MSRAAFILECSYFVHCCNKGQWPNWMKLNFPIFRPSGPLSNRGAPSGLRRTPILQRTAGKMFHQWAEVREGKLTSSVLMNDFISVINQLDAQNFCFTISLFRASTCFEHMYSSSGGKNCITQPLESSHLWVKIELHSLWYHHTYRSKSHYTAPGIITPIGQNRITQPLVSSHL